MFTSWLHQPVKTVSKPMAMAAQDHFARLSGPPGALGALEEIAVRMAAMSQRMDPEADPAQITLFFADHGVAHAGVAGISEDVTPMWLRNCLRGTSASAVMARSLGLRYEVVDLGLARDPGPLPGLIQQRIGPGTTDFRTTPAMSEQQLFAALGAGRDAVLRADQAGCRLFIGGEAGSGRTTSAGALVCALLGIPPESIAGPGSGISPEALAVKAQVIQEAVDHHARFFSNPLDVLRRLGGYETVALCGAYITCGQVGMAAVVDGFCSSVAALVAATLHPTLNNWLFFGHHAAEPGQYPIFRSLNSRPLLHLDMRLGEGTGALAAFPIIRAACSLLKHTLPPPQ
ncbi:MAG: nicotinate-nucleotide--dimethylbenzimidazole phosphoribosyltransferase [Magnetococcales bacterium]|nr:nicotinate-nucleotide--dimethylbenzimidazole phosphoribosyltransferase [Magnetococcales bacterium]NGZ04859.1 nicotinate-nucleotide--dimethylbenzimidazole phosphoribosyltransferase [Magnetococcales bacterium]